MYIIIYKPVLCFIMSRLFLLKSVSLFLWPANEMSQSIFGHLYVSLNILHLAEAVVGEDITWSCCGWGHYMKQLWVRTLHEAVVGEDITWSCCGWGHYMKLLWVRTLHGTVVGEDITWSCCGWGTLHEAVVGEDITWSYCGWGHYMKLLWVRTLLETLTCCLASLHALSDQSTNQPPKDLRAETCAKRKSTSVVLYNHSCVNRIAGLSNKHL